MKLYTEEQVRKMLLRIDDFIYQDFAHDTVLSEHTPIELPSDEKIDEQAFQVSYDGTNEFYDKSFIKGARWIKEQIINQTKEL